MRLGCKPVLLMFLCASCGAQDWPQFRGPTGQGLSSVKSLPLEWADDAENIAWKSAIGGLGWSSPVVQGEQIWLTTAADDGTSLRAVCLDRATGRELHNVELFKTERRGRIHDKNSHASPTPIIEGNRVYVHFGALGTACVTTRGEIVWRTNIDYNHVHGPGGSPVVHGDLLIVSCDGAARQFVTALDKATGKVRWSTPRPAASYFKKFAFCTPLVVAVNGRDQVVVPGANNVCGYEPKTGRQIWNVTYEGGYSVVPRPVFGHGMVFFSTGFDSPALLAVRVDGRGDVTDSHVAWTFKRGAPLTPSPLLIGDELYIISDRGVAACLDAKTGDIHWQERIGGNFSASPLYAAGRIYLLDENGTTVVIKPGKSFEELARNKITGRTLASLTPLEGVLLLRTNTHLLRIDAGSP